MKTKLLIMIFISLFCVNKEVSAQSFWKQLGKAAEQVGKELLAPTTEKQQNTEPVNCDEELTQERMSQIFFSVYGQNAKLPERFFAMNPEKILCYGVYDQVGWLLALEKKDCKWGMVKQEEIGTVMSGSSVDSLHVVSGNGKQYLYYEYYMTGGNVGNYNIFFSLVDADTYTTYMIEYECYPVKSTGKIETKKTPTDNLTGQTILSDFLIKKLNASSRIFREKKVEVPSLNVPKTKSVMSLSDAYNKHLKRLRITAAERSALKIDYIKNEFFSKRPNKELSKGKLFYQGANGKMQSIFILAPDHATWEFLVSYDAKGNYVDCVMIGQIMDYAGDRAESVVEGNKIQVHSTWPVYEDEGGDGNAIVKYEITPELKFIKLD